MVFRLAHSEYSNRHTFEASVQRRSWLRRLVLVTTLMMLAFSSSWVVLLALGGAVPAWLGCVSFGLRFRDGSKPPAFQDSSDEDRPTAPAPSGFSTCDACLIRRVDRTEYLTGGLYP